MAEKTWYAARLLFVSERPANRRDDRLCEDSVVLVCETSEAAARRAAEEIAAGAMQPSYENEDGEVVQWRFVGVVEVQDLCESRIEPGTEVYSRLFYESDTADAELKSLLSAASPVA